MHFPAFKDTFVGNDDDGESEDADWCGGYSCEDGGGDDGSDDEDA